MTGVPDGGRSRWQHDLRGYLGVIGQVVLAARVQVDAVDAPLARAARLTAGASLVLAGLLNGGAQYVGHLDEVCYDFPELKLVMRHGAQPWEELAVKLMLKWPNLYYSTSGFAPKYIPQAIIDYANSRGGDKVLYTGYFPFGLELSRIFAELDELPLREHVWSKFLSENARTLLKLPA